MAVKHSFKKIKEALFNLLQHRQPKYWLNEDDWNLYLSTLEYEIIGFEKELREMRTPIENECNHNDIRWNAEYRFIKEVILK